MPESDLYPLILQDLRLRGCVAWRGKSAGRIHRGRQVKSDDSGRCDIELIVPPLGRFVGLEIKTPKGKLRDTQLDFMAKAQAVGGQVFVIHDWPEYEYFVKNVLEPMKKCLDYSQG